MNSKLSTKSLLAPLVTAFELLVRVLVVISVAKVVATLFGAPTLARYTAYSNIFAVISVFSVSAVNSGMIQQLAGNHFSSKKFYIQICRSLVGTFSIAATVIMISIASCILFKHLIEEAKVDFIVEIPMVLYLMGACMMYYVVTSYAMLLNISRDLVRLAIYRIAVSLFMLLFFLVAIEFIGEAGVYTSIPAGYVIVGFIILLVHRLEIWKIVCRFQSYFRAADHLRFIKIGGVLGIASILGPIVQIIIRYEMVSDRGLDFAGYWDALWRISDAISTIGVSYLLVFLIPALARRGKSIISKKTKLLFYIFTISYALGIAFLNFNKNLFIKLLYSGEFQHISDGLILVLAGGYFRIIGAAINYAVLIKGRISHYFFNELVCGVAFILGVIGLETLSIYNLSFLSLIVSMLYVILSYVAILKVRLYEPTS